MSSEAAEEEKNANEDPLLGFMFGNIGQDEELENEYELDKVSGGCIVGQSPSVCVRLSLVFVLLLGIGLHVMVYLLSHFIFDAF
jgi:hypothetical protein